MKNEKMSYEDALKRLEEIVSALENKETSLDDSMKLFEEGTKLADFCNKKLSEAKQKITELNKE